MARLDRIKNLTGLVDWYGACPRLRAAANLLVVGGHLSPDDSKDAEERQQIERMHELFERHDLEGQVRRILDFCGLPFESACVEFHRSNRPVNTASAEQVREPIYSSAVDFWMNYEPWLDELHEVLAPVL